MVEAFGTSVSDEDFYSLETVGDVLNYIDGTPG
jgi:acyl carrier protein